MGCIVALDILARLVRAYSIRNDALQFSSISLSLSLSNTGQAIHLKSSNGKVEKIVISISIQFVKSYIRYSTYTE